MKLDNTEGFSPSFEFPTIFLSFLITAVFAILLFFANPTQVGAVGTFRCQYSNGECRGGTRSDNCGLSFADVNEFCTDLESPGTSACNSLSIPCGNEVPGVTTSSTNVGTFGCQFKNGQCSGGSRSSTCSLSSGEVATFCQSTDATESECNSLTGIACQEEIPTGPTGGVNIGTDFKSPFGLTLGVGSLVSAILSNGLIIGGVIFLFLLIFLGISVIISAGKGDAEAAAKRRQAATTALIGFVIIFATFWIIKIIEAVTGANILNPGF